MIELNCFHPALTSVHQALPASRLWAGECSVLASEPAVYFSKECKLSKAVGLEASVTVGGAQLPLNNAVSAAVEAAAPAAAAVRAKPALLTRARKVMS